MPYKTDKMAIGDPHLDRRFKIMPEQRAVIKQLHKRGSSIRGLARMFDVHKSTIAFILYPERYARNVELRIARGGSKIYYDREKHTETTREHRRYKHFILTDRTNEKPTAPKQRARR
jgi:transposase